MYLTLAGRVSQSTSHVKLLYRIITSLSAGVVIPQIQLKNVVQQKEAV